MVAQQQLEIDTRGRGSVDITRQIDAIVRASGIQTGLCHVFIEHTSASLLLTENADPAVHRDLEQSMSRLAPDGDPAWEHSSEGPDDMAAHVRSMLTESSLTLPIVSGACGLGTLQGVYVWEHRHRGHRRRVTVTCIG